MKDGALGMDADRKNQFQDWANRELKRAERYRSFLSLVVFNLSGFLSTVGQRKINSPDEINRFLAGLVERVVEGARESDLVSTLDNARLALLLPETDDEAAAVAAGRFQTLISEYLGALAGTGFNFEVPPEITSFPGRSDQRSLKVRLGELEACR